MRTTPAPQTITRLLNGAHAGEASAAEALIPLVYSELKSLAHAGFSAERSGHTLQPTALIHEAWLKLGGHLAGLESRQHFYAVAAQAMRQVLTDHARARGRQKRGDGAMRLTLDEQLGRADGEGLDLVDLADSLNRLAALNERHARMVELRVFCGLTIPETATILEVSHATVERDWFTVRAWLRRELGLVG